MVTIAKSSLKEKLLSMRIGIVVCSSCDLPESFIKENDIQIMPVSLKFKDGEFIDTRDPVATQTFYKKYLEEKDLEGETSSMSVKRISNWFLDELVLKYDRVLVITMTKNRSPVFENATKASFGILSGYRQKRRDAGLKGSFALRVIDSTNLFTGEAVIAYEAARLKREKIISFDKWRSYIDKIAKHTHGFLVPNDLYYLRNVARKKGDKQLTATKYFLAKTLNIKPISSANQGETKIHDKAKGFDQAVSKLLAQAKNAIDEGLLVPIICMSFSGNPKEITSRKDYQALIEYANKHNIEHTMSVMSITAGINLGPGTFSLAYATMA